jgi:hypothetical protein
VHTRTTPQEVILETADRRNAQAMQLDQVALSLALATLAAGMEQIEQTLYKLMLLR